jgi:Icc-related predicted phosphoesterase
VPFWLCVGDVADAHGRYEALPAPLYWIKGNNENFDVLCGPGECAAGVEPPPYIDTYIPNGHLIELEGLRIAGLGGTFAPTMYEMPAAELPHPKKSSAKATELADRRRHFVREEVDACKLLEQIDIFLSHEAPRPFRVHRGIDAGKTPINEILSAMKPRLHLFGHHHRFTESVVLGLPSVCLDLISASYLLVDATTLDYERLTSPRS